MEMSVVRSTPWPLYPRGKLLALISSEPAWSQTGRRPERKPDSSWDVKTSGRTRSREVFLALSSACHEDVGGSGGVAPNIFCLGLAALRVWFLDPVRVWTKFVPLSVITIRLSSQCHALSCTVQAGQHCAASYSDNFSRPFHRLVFFLVSCCLNYWTFKLHVFIVLPRTKISEITEVILWETWSCVVRTPYCFCRNHFRGF
jgi:hypothetical protein